MEVHHLVKAHQNLLLQVQALLKVLVHRLVLVSLLVLAKAHRLVPLRVYLHHPLKVHLLVHQLASHRQFLRLQVLVQVSPLVLQLALVSLRVLVNRHQLVLPLQFRLHLANLQVLLQVQVHPKVLAFLQVLVHQHLLLRLLLLNHPVFM